MTQWTGTAGPGDELQTAWNCGQCQSLNRPRRSTCYSCGWPRQSVASGSEDPLPTDTGKDSGAGPRNTLPPPAFVRPPAHPTIYCFACGVQIDARAEICPKCGVRQRSAPSVATPAQSSSTWSSIAIICGVVALIIFPIVFGPIGIVLAAIGASRGEPRWKAAMAVVVVLMLISMALGAYFATRTH